MITLQEVEVIHEILIEKFGGSSGIRDREILESAINRPYHTFDQNDLYPLPVDKAAAIFESLISNHPFVDGNKRTAYVVMRLLLLESNLDIYATQNEKYEFVMRAAKAEIKFDQIREWLTKYVR
jgi:death-on-curing protein